MSSCQPSKRYSNSHPENSLLHIDSEEDRLKFDQGVVNNYLDRLNETGKLGKLNPQSLRDYTFTATYPDGIVLKRDYCKMMLHEMVKINRENGGSYRVRELKKFRCRYKARKLQRQYVVLFSHKGGEPKLGKFGIIFYDGYSKSGSIYNAALDLHSNDAFDALSSPVRPSRYNKDIDRNTSCDLVLYFAYTQLVDATVKFQTIRETLKKMVFNSLVKRDGQSIECE